MTDGIIKGTGDSRYLKGAGWPSTYAEFKAMAEAGTLPFDLNGINAAGWQQIGTALNKANLLSDTTATKLGGVETPNAAFDLLSRFHAGLGNEYVWAKSHQESHVGVSSTASTAYLLNSSSNASATVTYADSYTVSDGAAHLVNPQTQTCSYRTASDWNIVKGKYFLAIDRHIYYANPDATITRNNSSNYLVYLSAYKVITITETITEYVNAPSSDAYPPAVSDGYVYTALGQIGNKVQFASGSYTGTGLNGGANPVSIVAGFAPKAAIIFKKTARLSMALADFGVWVSGCSNLNAYYDDGNSSLTRPVTANSSGLSFYAYGTGSTPETQLNASGVEYEYNVWG